jgi:hypothetical protein
MVVISRLILSRRSSSLSMVVMGAIFRLITTTKIAGSGRARLEALVITTIVRLERGSGPPFATGSLAGAARHHW